jgi:putative NADPH-quinone reductase
MIGRNNLAVHFVCNEAAMKISVILGHPHKKSFNHAIADAVVVTLCGSGHEVIFHDLYEEKFNPVLEYDEIANYSSLDPVIQRYCSEISTAGGIVIVHPNWWGQPPAVLKGWIDRVIRAGVAYEFSAGDIGEGVPAGLLTAKTALVFNTSDTPGERELAVFGDPLETIWKNCVFDYCGVKNFYRKTYGVIANSTPEQRKLWLRDVRETAGKYFPHCGG